LRDNPALRDPVAYTSSPSQGYQSPTGNGKGKSPGQGQTRGQMKPPHRLVEALPPQRWVVQRFKKSKKIFIALNWVLIRSASWQT